MGRPAGMNVYEYDGPVMEDGGYHLRRWKASTVAPTEQKARANLIYRFKKDNGIFMGAHISLPGKFTKG